MSLFLKTLLFTFVILHAEEISVEDARIDIEAINFNLVYTWLVHNDRKSIFSLFTDDAIVTINDATVDTGNYQTDHSIDLLLKFKTLMEITDGDFMTNTIDISSDDNIVLITETGQYYFYNEKNIIVDAGTYETIWKLNDLAPKYLITSITIQSVGSNENNLYFDEHDMGVFWVQFWDSIGELNDKNIQQIINDFLSRFSIYFELNFVDTNDVERVLYGRKQLIEWMSNYNGNGMYGSDRLILHRNEDIIMFKLSPWQSVFEANVVLINRKTRDILKEERWLFIMGYDVINRQFYRATQFYDEMLLDKEIRQIQKRFPFARDKLPKKEL
eukprot:418503_1